MGLVLVVLRFAPILPAQPPLPSRSPETLPPFLEAFRSKKDPPVVTREVNLPTATGKVRGQLTFPDVKNPLPALVLLPDDKGLTGWIKQSAAELASIGYVVLTLDLEKHTFTRPPIGNERLLADLAGAVRWLRRQPQVLPGSIGVLGWSEGADRALALAATTPVQACVACFGNLSAEPALLAGLRATPVLVLVAGQDKSLPAFRKVLQAAGVFHKVRVLPGVSPGFMTPAANTVYNHAQAEAAWVEVYNFLDSFVEDAPLNGPRFASAPAPSPPDAPVASIADLMRAINGPAGVRVALVGRLEKEPAGASAWKQVRAEAALVAEAGGLLQQRQPRRGSMAHWRQQADTFTAAATKVVAAADRMDYKGARLGLDEIGQCCTTCHKQHR
jgi:carboxymethylenebutenolidase